MLNEPTRKIFSSWRWLIGESKVLCRILCNKTIVKWWRWSSCYEICIRKWIMTRNLVTVFFRPRKACHNWKWFHHSSLTFIRYSKHIQLIFSVILWSMLISFWEVVKNMSWKILMRMIFKYELFSLTNNLINNET